MAAFPLDVAEKAHLWGLGGVYPFQQQTLTRTLPSSKPWFIEERWTQCDSVFQPVGAEILVSTCFYFGYGAQHTRSFATGELQECSHADYQALQSTIDDGTSSIEQKEFWAKVSRAACKGPTGSSCIIYERGCTILGQESTCAAISLNGTPLCPAHWWGDPVCLPGNWALGDWSSAVPCCIKVPTSGPAISAGRKWSRVLPLHLNRPIGHQGNCLSDSLRPALTYHSNRREFGESG